MKAKPDIAEVIKQLHLMVDGFETTLQWAFEANGYPTIRVTIGDHAAGDGYVLVVGVEEPEPPENEDDD